MSSSVLAGEYQVIDSNTRSDPAFGFEDISTTGTDITSGFTSIDDSAVSIALPFDFTLYGQPYSTAWVSSNGFLTFASANAEAYFNTQLPSTRAPNAAAYPFWDDLWLTSGTASVSYAALGTGNNQRFVVQWTNIGTYDGSDEEAGATGATFQVALYKQTGNIVMRYQNVFFGDEMGHDAGALATVGIENADGTDGVQYSYYEAALSNGLGIKFYRYQVALTPPKLSMTGSKADPLTSTSAVTLVPVFVTPGSSQVTTLTLSTEGRVVATSIAQGAFNVPVVLPDGEYDVSGSVVDANGLSDSANTHVIVDTHAPVVELPGVPAVVHSGTLDLNGLASDAVSGVCSVAVDGTPVTLYVDGTFSSTVALKRGVNTVDIEAVDKLGNRSVTECPVTYALPATVRPYSVTMVLGKKDVCIDGSWETGAAAPMMYKGKVYLPAAAVLQLAGGTARYANGICTIAYGGRTSTVGVGGEGGTVMGGVYYLPMEYLRDVVGIDLAWESNSQTISFTRWP